LNHGLVAIYPRRISSELLFASSTYLDLSSVLIGLGQLWNERQRIGRNAARAQKIPTLYAMPLNYGQTPPKNAKNK
jgi:hypothetical protein